MNVEDEQSSPDDVELSGKSLDEARRRFAADVDAAVARFGLLAGVDEDEIGSALDLGIGDATRERAPAPAVLPEDVLPVVPALPPPLREWYLGVQGSPLGPMSAERVLELWASGEVSGETVSWKTGMADWAPLWRVHELSVRRAPRPVSTHALESDARPVVVSTLAQDELDALSRPRAEPTYAPPPASPDDPAPLPELELFSHPAAPLGPEPVTSALKSATQWLPLAAIVFIGLLFAVVLAWAVARARTPRVIVVPAPVVAKAVTSPVPPPVGVIEVHPAVVAPSAPKAAPVIVPPTAKTVAERAASETRPGKEAAVAAAPEPSGDDFDAVFGVKKAAVPQNANSAQPRATYVPPAPGNAAVPEALGTAELTRVAVDHRPALVACAKAQHQAQPGVTGTVVMQFAVSLEGKVSDVKPLTAAFAKSPFAACLSREIPGWTFPRHQTAGAPIQFPFKF